MIARAVMSPRIRMFVAAVFVGLASGSNYVFSGYAPQLAARLEITSTDSNLVGLGGNLGMYLCGPIWGKLVDTYGPRYPLLAAAILNFVGYTSVRLFYLGVFPIRSSPEMDASRIRVFLLAFSMFLTGTAGSAGLTGAMNAVARSFPDRTRASATGTVLAGFGLSAFVFSTLGHAVYHGEAGGLLLLLSLGTMLPDLVGTFVVRAHPPNEDGEDEEDEVLFGDEGENALAREVSLGADFGSNEMPPIRRSLSYEIEERRGGSDGREGAAAAEPLLTPGGRRKRRRRDSGASIPPTELHHGPRDLFRSTDFHLLFAVLALLCGVGLEWINNVGAVTLALARDGINYDRHRVATLQASQVATISVFNCAGRILGGAFSDFVKIRFAVRRIWFLPIVAAMFIGAEVAVLATTNVNHLWLVSAWLGFAYGSLFNVLPMLILEWFGMSHFSQNFGWTTVAPVLGGNVFNLVFGRVYDSNTVGRIGNMDTTVTDSPTTGSVVAALAAVQTVADSKHECLLGRQCYATAFKISAMGCVLALILSIIAGIRRERQRAQRRRTV